ncbi:MAG: hypothetical protein KJO44_00895 [Gemmatimonadetes bacterium]|nr:hypothetical protein [Gemmatimonadota bacterium]MBT8479384.1 hypothetical protein [Gemmatimonadota bacterium]NNK49601.1 hypothetical protein [Gemmatimonadota bacterium]
MSSIGRRMLFVAAFSAVAAVFAVQNGAVHVPLHLGIVRLRSVSLPVVVFTAIVVGMLMVLLAGLRADLKTRRMLRRYRDALSGASEEP